MFTHIVPNRRLPKQFSGFTYEVPKDANLRLGQFVVVPLRNQKIVGLVTGLQNDTPSYSAKMVDQILEPRLPEYMIPLFEWMSKKYDTSFASVLQTCLPDAVWPRIAKIRKAKKTIEVAPLISLKETPLPQKKIDVPLGAKILEFAKTILQKRSTFVLEQTPLPRAAFYSALQKNILADEQILFIVPETQYANPIKEDFPIFTGDLSARDKKAICSDVAHGTIQAICGTRAALFLPFKNLAAIVVDYEHNENYAEKRSPKYHALDVAKKIAELKKIPLIIVSATPRVETWHEVSEGVYEMHSWNDEHNVEAHIISMTEERRKSNFGNFSEAAMSHIARTLALGQQVLLFSHRTGQAGALICRDCGNVFRCETCSNVLAVHAGNVLKCHTCKTEKPIPYSCPKCKNVKLKSIGFGTQALEEEMKEIFGRAKILRLDSETKKNIDSQKLAEADIIIATSIIEKPLNLPRLMLSVAVMPDSLLQFPHFRAAERVLQILTHIKNLTNPKGEMLIQTFLPDHAIFTSIAKNRLQDFYESELRVRKTLLLPPF